LFVLGGAFTIGQAAQHAPQKTHGPGPRGLRARAVSTHPQPTAGATATLGFFLGNLSALVARGTRTRSGCVAASFWKTAPEGQAATRGQAATARPSKKRETRACTPETAQPALIWGGWSGCPGFDAWRTEVSQPPLASREERRKGHGGAMARGALTERLQELLLSR
jgi:hypothetical protein